MKITDRFTTYPGGVPLAAKDVDLLLHDGDTPLQTVATDSGGFVTFTRNGSPGIVRWVLDDAGEIREIYGNMSPQVGHLYADELPRILDLFGPSVISGLEVTAPGGKFIQVGTGAAVGQQNLYVQHTAESLAVADNVSGATRNDLVFCYLGGATSVEPWETYIRYLADDHGLVGNLVLTSLGLTGKVVRLATVAVPNGFSAVTGGMITDVRTYAAPAMADHAITLPKLHAGGATNGQALIYNAGTGDWVPGNAGRTFQKRGTSETDRVITGTSLVKVLDLTFPALPTGQSFVLGVTGWVNAEGAQGGYVDGAVGIQVDGGTTVQSGTARWEGGVDSTQHHEHETTVTGDGATFVVSLWTRRIANQNMNFKRCGMYILATPA